jgi:hypothetical protein
VAEELVDAFVEGRLTRRAFVRQLVDGGMAMPDALAYADSLVPPAPPPESVAAPPEPRASDRPLPNKPVRTADLVIEFVGDGYLVYHPTQNRMHSLNHTAALVLELCTGENDVPQIARWIERGFQLPSAPEQETRECVESLFAEDLVR